MATCVWKVGYPERSLKDTRVGYVMKGEEADKAGFQPGDRITHVNDVKIESWIGKADTSLTAQIILSEGEKIRFKVQRDGEEIELVSGYYIPESKHFWNRTETRKIGIGQSIPVIVDGVIDNSPAQLAGLQPGDTFTQVNGNPVYCYQNILDAIAETEGQPITIHFTRNDQELTATLTPRKPEPPFDGRFDLGIHLRPYEVHSQDRYPNPYVQIKESLNTMLLTIQKVSSSESSLGLEHLSGPAGIAKTYFEMLKSPEGWKIMLWFTVLFNINLAVLNMLPLPVLDGGHITLAIFELIFRRPLNEKVLIYLQTACALMLMGFMLFVTFKDVGDLFKGEKQPTRPAPPSIHATRNDSGIALS